MKKRDALKAAAKAVSLGAIPGVNLIVAMVATMTAGGPIHGEEDRFNKKLAMGVAISSYFWVPALVIMPFALAYLVMNAVIESVEKAIEKAFPKEESLSPSAKM